MSERIQKQRPAPQERKTEETVEPAEQDTAILDETDDLLDEIDSILEGQEVLVNFRQKGGQ